MVAEICGNYRRPRLYIYTFSVCSESIMHDQIYFIRGKGLGVEFFLSCRDYSVFDNTLVVEIGAKCVV